MSCTKASLELLLLCTSVWLLQTASSAALNLDHRDDVDSNSVVLQETEIPQTPSPTTMEATNSTPTPDIDSSDQRQTMLKSIRQHILAKLNLQTEPSGSNITEEQLHNAMASYNAYLQGRDGQEQSRQEETTQKCGAGGTTHFSRRSKIYYPGHFVYSELQSQLYTKSEEDVKQPLIDPKHVSKSTPSPAPSTSRPLYKVKFNDLDFINQNNRIWSVTLQLYKRKADSTTYADYTRGMNPVEAVKVFRVMKKFSDNGKWIKKHVLLAVKDVPSEDEGFVSFNITSGIKDWLQHDQSQMELELAVLIATPQSVDTGATFPSAIVFDVPSPTTNKEYGTDAKNARLLVERLNEKERLDSILKRRRKRQQTVNIDNEHCFNNTDETNCCIKELTVDFKELGMDWIIYPPTFTPNYCKGQCTDLNWPTATHSTSYLIKLRESNPTAAAEPCCVAHDLQPLTVLMALNNEVVVNEIPDMITNSCICR